MKLSSRSEGRGYGQTGVPSFLRVAAAHFNVSLEGCNAAMAAERVMRAARAYLEEQGVCENTLLELWDGSQVRFKKFLPDGMIALCKMQKGDRTNISLLQVREVLVG